VRMEMLEMLMEEPPPPEGMLGNGGIWVKQVLEGYTAAKLRAAWVAKRHTQQDAIVSQTYESLASVSVDDVSCG
jgi:hypothetical protein